MIEHETRSGSRTELERRALLAVRTLVDHMRTLYRELERSTDAPIAAHRALACVGDDPGMTASRLATELGMLPSATSHVLKSLESRGWIERRRSTADQRSVHIHITGEGRRLLRATRGRAVGALQRGVGRLRTAELAPLAEGIESLLAALPPAPKLHNPARKAQRSRSRRPQSPNRRMPPNDASNQTRT
jgi:DNA-binding MarR family transcriptional regulator